MRKYMSLRNIILATTLAVVFVAYSLWLYFYGIGAGISFQRDLTRSKTPTITGEQVFDSINAYREKNGQKALPLSRILCENIAQRYLDIMDGLSLGESHYRLQIWANKHLPENYSIEEDFAFGNDVETVMKFWDNSPGHKASLLSPEHTSMCTYSSSNLAIVIFKKN